MKKLALLPLITLCAGATLAINANADSNEKLRQDSQAIATVASSSIAGALAGGPVGLLVGFLGGAYLSELNKKNVQSNARMEYEIAELESELSEKSITVEDLSTKLANKLEFQVMFSTGDDNLTVQAIKRIDSLAAFLIRNPQLTIRLDGFADPRGTDEYNNVLSRERALSVAKALLEKGVSEERIAIHAHGASQARQMDGSHDALAFERRVNIEVFDNTNAKVAIVP